MKTSFDELQLFITIIDSGSMTAAAEHLGLTVSAASRTLRRLEKKLQTSLLQRTTRRLELTEEGAVFLQQARAIIASIDAAEEQIMARRVRPAGRLRIDAATPFILHSLVPLLEGFRRRYPDIALELNSNEGIIDLIEKHTDVAFRIGSLKDSTLHARLIGNSRIRILASPAYLERHGMPTEPAQLAQHSLLGFSHPKSLNDWPLKTADGNMSLPVEPAIASSSGEALRHMALAGLGIVCLSDFMTREDRQSGRLVQILAGHTQIVSQPVNAVYYRNTVLAAHISSFIDYMIQTLGKKPFDG